MITQQVLTNQVQIIKDAKFKIEQINYPFNVWNYTGAISNNLKYIIVGGSDELVKIWKLKTNNLIQSIKMHGWVMSCKFTENSDLLFVGIHQKLLLFCVNNNFKKLQQQYIHDGYINFIQCITNSIILTADDETIIKTNVNAKQQLLKIQGSSYFILGIDYNRRLNIIASGSNEGSIKLWNGIEGFLIIEKLKAHIYQILSVIFHMNNQQLISQDYDQNLIIWNINYDTKQLEQYQLIANSGFNVSLAQQYLITTGRRFIFFQTFEGELVRQFEHSVDYYRHFNTIQNDSIRAVLIQGIDQLQVCKLEIDIDNINISLNNII